MSIPDAIRVEYIGRLSTEKFYFDFSAMRLYERLNDILLHYKHETPREELLHAKNIMLKEQELRLVNRDAYTSRLERLVNALSSEGDL